MLEVDFGGQAIASVGVQYLSSLGFTTPLKMSNAQSMFALGSQTLETLAVIDGYDLGAITGLLVYDAEIEKQFKALKEAWHGERNPLTSSTDEMAMTKSYQQIIGMGASVVPFILRELQRELQQDGEPDHWFWALVAITRENPSVPEDRGNILKMARAWLRWGVNRGYLSGQALGADVS